VDKKIAEEILDELLSSLEALETQTSAMMQFLKDKRMGNEKQLAPYLDRAGKASNVRWRAARLRFSSLLSSAMKSEEESRAKSPEKKAEEKPAPASQDTKSEARHLENEAAPAEKAVASSQNAPASQEGASSRQEAVPTPQRKETPQPAPTSREKESRQEVVLQKGAAQPDAQTEKEVRAAKDAGRAAEEPQRGAPKQNPETGAAAQKSLQESGTPPKAKKKDDAA
jgi:hypothetical protein